MIATLLLAAAAGSSAGALPQTPGVPPEVTALVQRPVPDWAPPRPERRELEGGSPLLVLVDHTLPLVEGRVIVRAGSVHEPADLAGLTDLLADVLRRGGSESLAGPDLDLWLDAHGAELDVEADRETLTVTWRCLAEDAGALWDIVGDLLAHPAYPEADVAGGKARLLTAIARRADDPEELARIAADRIAYGADSPWSRVPEVETVERIDREALLAFHRAHVGRDRLLVGLVGDLDLDAATEDARAALEPLPLLGPPEEVPPPAFLQPARTTVYVLDRPGVPQTELRIIAPGTRRLDPDAPALSVWSFAIGLGGFGNRMVQRVRVELGLAYTVGATFIPGWSRSGRFEAWCGTRNEAVAEALGAMLDVLRGGLEPMSEAERAAVRRRMENLRVFRADRPEKVLEDALLLARHGYPPDHRDHYDRAVRETTAEEAAAAARRHLDLDRLIVLAVGPADAIEPALAPFGEVRRLEDGASSARAEQEPARADGLAERILAAVGGREAWRSVRFLEFQQHLEVTRPEGGPTLDAHTWLDLAGPRMRVVQGGAGGDVVFLVTPERVGVRRDEQWTEFQGPARSLMQLRARRDLHRLLRLLARGELARFEPAPDGSLSIETEDGVACRLVLDEESRPAQLVVVEDGREVRFRFSNWMPVGGLLVPGRIEKEDEREAWVREVTEARAPAVLDDALFETP